MNIHKLIKIALFTCIVNVTHAQMINSVVGVGISAIATDDKMARENLEANYNIHIGANYQQYITDFFSLDIGAQYSLKGAKLVEPTFMLSAGLYLHYLEFPLIARIHFKLFGKDIFLDGGVFKAMGIIGHVTSDDFVYASEIVKFDGTPNSLKRWDSGLTFGGGYKSDGNQFRLSFDYSTSDIDPGAGSHHNGVFKISYIRSILNFKKKTDQ